MKTPLKTPLLPPAITLSTDVSANVPTSIDKVVKILTFRLRKDRYTYIHENFIQE